ncbi:branched-chain amino acid ABC transporter permease [Castellaniella ginsengisoli]|jgi:branched-chain amino acid transport system permease protein|uniref:Branched-chain amino acid ABC transporter permease n=1 Tax=Castellaniella ginsengisoli TaxID=546114 RepID=A0AB39EET6_9BURK
MTTSTSIGTPSHPHPGAADALARYRRSARWKPLEYLFWCLPVLAYFAFPGNYLLLSQIAITSLFALSLDLIFGYAGIISLGHAAFFGVGAYTVGLLGSHGLGDPLLGLALAAVIAAAVGFLSSFLLLRGNDLSRLMVTLGVALMLYELANKFTSVTGGVDGMPGVEVKPILGMFSFDMYGRVGYVYSVIVLFVLFWFARRMVHSPFGQSLRGIHMNALRMPALGVPVNRRLVIVYTIGAGYAGVAGALLAQTNSFVSLDVLSFQRSADLLLILILGGAGHLYGGLLGSIAFVVAHYLLSDMNPQYWQFWLGLILVLVVLFARGGILGTARKWIESSRHRAESRARSETPS